MAIFDPPQNQHPLIDHQNIWYRWLRRLPLRLCQIWWKSVHGGFWANYWWNITNFLFILLFIPFFMNSPTDQTRRRIFTLDGSNDADSRKDVLLGVSLTLLPILGVKSPENPNFGGVNRRFQAKRTKYWKFHVIETTASIWTKFCKTVETIKNSSWAVSIGAQQIQDGGRPQFSKNR